MHHLTLYNVQATNVAAPRTQQRTEAMVYTAGSDRVRAVSKLRKRCAVSKLTGQIGNHQFAQRSFKIAQVTKKRGTYTINTLIWKVAD